SVKRGSGMGTSPLVAWPLRGKVACMVAAPLKKVGPARGQVPCPRQPNHGKDGRPMLAGSVHDHTIFVYSKSRSDAPIHEAETGHLLEITLVARYQGAAGFHYHGRDTQVHFRHAKLER